MAELNEPLPASPVPMRGEPQPQGHLDPPLVILAGQADGVLTPASPALEKLHLSRRLAPGLLEAILWCIAFLATQVVSLVMVLGLVLCFYAVQAPDAQQFLYDQLKGFSDSAKAKDSASAIPNEIGNAIAWGMLAAQVASVGLILIVLPWRVGRDWRRQLGFRRPEAIHVLLVFIMVPGFMVLTSSLESLLKATTGYSVPSTDQNLRSTFRSFPWVLTFLAAAFGPGLVEEIWCRGFLGRGLAARYGLIPGVILTSILFGLLHCDLMYAAVVTGMGIGLHLVYLATRSIWASILLHTLNNGIALLLVLTRFADHLDNASQDRLLALFLAAFVLMISGGIAFWTSRTRLVTRGENGSSSLQWVPEYYGISAPPAGSGLALQAGRVNPVSLAFAILGFTVLMGLIVF